MNNNQRWCVLTTALAVALLFYSACQSDDNSKDQQQNDAPSYASARAAMVREQIDARGIEDRRILDAMQRVPRHLFVPENVREFSYRDSPLPIGNDQTISQPYIVALMTNLAHLDGAKKVLEVGTGSGYQAAILGELAKEVYSIEIVEELALKSAQLLDSMGYKNITVRAGDGYAGWEEEAPFDAIIVTCAPPEIPRPLLDQLAEGGRLILPVGDKWQELILVVRTGDKFDKSSITPVRFVPMTGEGIKSQGKEEDK